MEIVIDMPEEMWERVKDGYVPLGISKYLRNGVSLPKGHGRLIDESDLIPDSDYEDGIFYSVSIGAINGAPTIVEADKEESEE